MTSETLNATSSLAFNERFGDDLDDTNITIQNILNDPTFISALDNITQGNEINENPTEVSTLGQSSGLRAFETIRIALPAMASPNSVYSSSSESCTSIQVKKHRKRICIECNERFKHTTDWQSHLKTHIRQPCIRLTPINEQNSYYKNYLHRRDTRKRRASTDSGSLKITIKLPRRDLPVVNGINGTNENTSESSRSQTPIISESNTNETNIINRYQISQSKPECRIRVLKAEEIKQSPPHTPVKNSFPSNAMVSLPMNESRVHYECPTLDGLSQFAEDAMNEESTAQLLQKLLDAPNPADTNEFVANEFISIDRLAHTCTICNQKFPDISFLREHQRNTGHNMSTNLRSPILTAPPIGSILEPIQEMSVDMHRQYHPPQSNQLDQILNHPKNGPNANPNMPMYGQPRVLPLHQMENQVANFPKNISPMGMPPGTARPTPPVISDRYNGGNGSPRMPNRSRLPGTSHFQLPRITPRPPQQLMRTNNNQIGQPVNMTPFLEMSPDMYHPRQQMNNMPNPYLRQPPNHLMNRCMPPGPISIMSRFPNMQQQMHQHPSQLPQQTNREPPSYAMRPPMTQASHLFQNQARPQSEALKRARDVENRSFISNAPRSDGLPVIESVQSGISMNPPKKIDTKKPIQLNDQITLSVKTKEQLNNKPTMVDTNNVANILVHRGITVKPTGKLSDKAKTSDESMKTPYATAEQAVQKLQMNNSVSIITKKKVTPPPPLPPPPPSTSSLNENTTIDLSNDDIEPVVTDNDLKKRIKCPIKACTMEYPDALSLRRHMRIQHQLPRYRCTICSMRFQTPDAVKLHLKKAHSNQSKPQPNLGIPIVDFNDQNARTKMIALGFTNYLPIGNTRNGGTELFGLPIINIDGTSMNNLKNLFNSDTTKVMPINSMRTIQKFKVPAAQPINAQTSIKKKTQRPTENTIAAAKPEN